MKLLAENAREITSAISEIFWNQRLTSSQAVEVNRVVQTIPERILTDDEFKSCVGRLVAYGLTGDEAQDIVNVQQASFGGQDFGGNYDDV